MSKLEEVKMNALCVMINKNGYDIDLLREAVRIGDFSAILQHTKEIILESEDMKREDYILDNENKTTILNDERISKHEDD